MSKHRHTIVPNSGIYVDSNNQLTLFNVNELPILVKPNTRLHNHDRQLKRDIVRKYITKRYGI